MYILVTILVIGIVCCGKVIIFQASFHSKALKCRVTHQKVRAGLQIIIFPGIGVEEHFHEDIKLEDFSSYLSSYYGEKVVE